jgi:hypothetical protein
MKKYIKEFFPNFRSMSPDSPSQCINKILFQCKVHDTSHILVFIIRMNESIYIVMEYRFCPFNII